MRNSFHQRSFPVFVSLRFERIDRFAAQSFPWRPPSDGTAESYHRNSHPFCEYPENEKMRTYPCAAPSLDGEERACSQRGGT